jgi:uncharacterized membrane protein
MKSDLEERIFSVVLIIAISFLNIISKVERKFLSWKKDYEQGDSFEVVFCVDYLGQKTGTLNRR